MWPDWVSNPVPLALELDMQPPDYTKRGDILYILQWLKWHPAAHVLLAGTVDGDVWMWKIPSGDCKTFQGPGCTASCGILMQDGKNHGLTLL